MQLKIKNGNSWESIPAGGIGVPSGGTSGQYLKKSSSTDYATEWETFPTVLTQTTGQLTAEISFTNIKTNKITRIGNLCCIQFEGTTNASLAGWARCFVVPSGFALDTDEEVQFNAVLADATTPAAFFDQNGSSGISFKTALTSGKKLSFSLSYICV